LCGFIGKKEGDKSHTARAPLSTGEGLGVRLLNKKDRATPGLSISKLSV
jgi:hypothetical protein